MNVEASRSSVDNKTQPTSEVHEDASIAWRITMLIFKKMTTKFSTTTSMYRLKFSEMESDDYGVNTDIVWTIEMESDDYGVNKTLFGLYLGTQNTSKLQLFEDDVSIFLGLQYACLKKGNLYQ